MPRSHPLVLLLVGALLGAASATAQRADLDVGKHAETDEIRLGDEAVFYIAVTNAGPDIAPGVEVEDVLPDGLAFASAEPSRGHYDAATGAWTVGTLAAGQTEVLALTTTLLADRTVRNCAAVRSSDAEDDNAANDASCTYVRPKREKLDPLALSLR